MQSTSRKCPNVCASCIDVEPIPPPTSTCCLVGGRPALCRPTVEVEVDVSLILIFSAEREDKPFRRPPGGSHAPLPDMAFPNSELVSPSTHISMNTCLSTRSLKSRTRLLPLLPFPTSSLPSPRLLSPLARHHTPHPQLPATQKYH